MTVLHDYCGSRRWAQAHAAKLQHLVGTCPDYSGIITAVEARKYHDSLFGWGVVKIWEYPNPLPGTPPLGGSAYMLLPEKMP